MCDWPYSGLLRAVYHVWLNGVFVFVCVSVSVCVSVCVCVSVGCRRSRPRPRPCHEPGPRRLSLAARALESRLCVWRSIVGLFFFICRGWLDSDVLPTLWKSSWKSVLRWRGKRTQYKPERKRQRAHLSYDANFGFLAVAAVMAEWLRRWTWNPMGYTRAGSNPARSVCFFSLFFSFLFFPPLSLSPPLCCFPFLKIK